MTDLVTSLTAQPDEFPQDFSPVEKAHDVSDT